MKKYPIFIFIIILTTNVSYGAGDFTQFGKSISPMRNHKFYNPTFNNGFNSTFNSMNYNNCYNPYSYKIVDNPITKIFKRHKSIINHSRNNLGSSYDSDLEYLLSKMEMNKFGQSYSDIDIESRLDRLDAQIFGAIQSGDFQTRLNRLKRAFSAENTRNYKAKTERLNDFREFFSSGHPTSIPPDDDYYSSLEGIFSSW